MFARLSFLTEVFLLIIASQIFITRKPEQLTMVFKIKQIAEQMARQKAISDDLTSADDTTMELNKLHLIFKSLFT